MPVVRFSRHVNDNNANYNMRQHSHPGITRMRLMAGMLLLHIGKMPEAFDGGGLGDAAAATPAASRFGMQMSPHNAAARQVSPICCVLWWSNTLQHPRSTDKPTQQRHEQSCCSASIAHGVMPHG